MTNIGDVINTGLQIIDKFVPDPGAKLQAQQELEKLKHNQAMAELDLDKTIAAGQNETNTAEAQHSCFYVAGWRPAIGWVCASSLGIFYIPQFIAGLILWIHMCWRDNALYQFPIHNDEILSLTFILLGVGGLRTIEKFKGVARL
jgi:hypothetical protein